MGTFLTAGTVRNEKNERNEKNDGNEMPILGLFRSYRSLSQNRSYRSSPLRHSPLARPVPPLPHAGEANVTYRSCLPRLRDCEAEARPADETAEAEQGQRSVFCKPAATGAAKTGHRNRGPQGRRGPRLRDCAAKTGHCNRCPQGRRGLDIPACLLYTKHRKGAAGQTVVPLVRLEK